MIDLCTVKKRLIEWSNAILILEHEQVQRMRERQNCR
jgi:hypothetical protein